MEIKRIGILLFFIVMVTISSVAYGASNIQKNGYVISIPDGWIEIPTDIIEKYEKMLSDLAPNAKKQHYDCGFQLDSKKNWFEYPYVLMQVNNLGRIPENQLEKLQGFSMQKSLDNFEDQNKKLNTVISNIQAGKMIYDNKNKMIWMRLEANMQDIGPIIGISGMILTEKGSIHANAYCKKEDFSTYEPVFRSIATSVTPAPELVYKPKWSDSLPVVARSFNWGKVVGKAITGAIIAGIIALIAGFIRKTKH
ncbi:MAG: hypothetical protein WCK60_03140 [Candidatus Nomurabacteria bacterium]